MSQSESSGVNLKPWPKLLDHYNQLTFERIQKVEHGWFFNYKVICKLDIPETEQEKFAGALGFVVNNDTGNISETSYLEWVDLGLAFHDDPYGNE